MKTTLKTLFLLSLLALLAACGGQAEPTPTKTPRPTATSTPLPTLASASLPIVERSGDAAPSDTPVTTGEQQSPLPTPADALSPLETPSPTAEPEVEATATPRPGFEAQAPVPVLAADLSCAEGCNAGNPDGIGLALLNLRSGGQFNTWVSNLDPLENEEYEGWVVAGSQVESTGRFNVDDNGTQVESHFLSAELAAVPWEQFVLTIEPEPDPDEAPAAPHSIGGTFRTTVMGEAFFNRFDLRCGGCHGATAEGGDTGPALARTALAYPDFVTAVRAHAQETLAEDYLGDRDLQHIYAWLVSIQ